MYYFDFYYLKNCPYSEKAKQLLDLKNIKYNLINVDQKNKELYKNNLINTFPQIYLKKYNSKGSVLLGGFNDLFFISSNITNDLDSTVKILRSKNNNLSKKASLRLIELFTNS